MGDLTLDFNRSEFRCKCGCGKDNISMALVNKLQQLRVNYGKPLKINSGCRCIKHNAAVGGKSNSAHICEGKEGEAADIHIESAEQLWDLVDLCFSLKIFKRIGIGTTLLHVDVSITNPTPRIWPYTDR